MARTGKGRQREATNNGRSAPAAKSGGTLGSGRAGQREASSAGFTNGRLKDQAEGGEHLHQRIAELAYVLYERSGFQQGKDLEHWLEAERQVKAVRGLAA
jgi:hypothetical protein